ncbi:MAG: GNAT family N-acetyltransferase [Acidobacteriota bacterium]|nr:GNAT family N-acetyltransferase [Acidobacteriota bacterium]
MEIRKVGLTDLKGLQLIGERSYTPHYEHLWKAGGVEWYMQRCFADEVLEKELSDENIEYYIISSDGMDIGILKLVLQKPVPNSEIENALYLEKIYFVKEWTGKGVGKRLIEFAFDRARTLNRDCVWLMAMDTSDKPIAAYERAGFQIHSRTRLDFEIMKEEFRGMVVMTHCFNKNGN